MLQLLHPLLLLQLLLLQVHPLLLLQLLLQLHLYLLLSKLAAMNFVRNFVRVFATAPTYLACSSLEFLELQLW